MTAPTDTVSLLGLGRMGEPMARNLLRGLGTLTVWNRTPEKADRLVDAGAAFAASPAAAAAPVTLTVFTDLADLEQVLHGERGLLNGWSRAAVRTPLLVVHSTVSPAAVIGLTARLRPSGIRVVDAPLSGGVDGAEQGRLSIMLGGAAADADELVPVLRHTATTILRMGDVGAGMTAKACNQVVVAATVAAIAEALLLGERSGLNRDDLLRVLSGGLANSELLRQKQARWAEEDYVGGGSSANQLKDLRIVQETAQSLGLELHQADATRRYFETLVIDDGDGALDHSGILRSLRRHTPRQVR